jgi:hypothetical protein
VSIPVPIFLDGFADDFYYEALRFDPGSPAYNQNVVKGNIYKIAYWVTLAINGGLFVNMGITLFHYLKAADRPIG